MYSRRARFANIVAPLESPPRGVKRDARVHVPALGDNLRHERVDVENVFVKKRVVRRRRGGEVSSERVVGRASPSQKHRRKKTTAGRNREARRAKEATVRNRKKRARSKCVSSRMTLTTPRTAVSACSRRRREWIRGTSSARRTASSRRRACPRSRTDRLGVPFATARSPSPRSRRALGRRRGDIVIAP